MENVVARLTETEAREIEQTLDSLWNVAMAGSIEIPAKTKRLYRLWSVRLAIAVDENGKGAEIAAETEIDTARPDAPGRE